MAGSYEARIARPRSVSTPNHGIAMCTVWLPWCTAQVKKIAAVAAASGLVRIWPLRTSGTAMTVEMDRYAIAMTAFPTRPVAHHMTGQSCGPCWKVATDLQDLAQAAPVRLHPTPGTASLVRMREGRRGAGSARRRPAGPTERPRAARRPDDHDRPVSGRPGASGRCRAGRRRARAPPREARSAVRARPARRSRTPRGSQHVVRRRIPPEGTKAEALLAPHPQPRRADRGRRPAVRVAAAGEERPQRLTTSS